MWPKDRSMWWYFFSTSIVTIVTVLLFKTVLHFNSYSNQEAYVSVSNLDLQTISHLTQSPLLKKIELQIDKIELIIEETEYDLHKKDLHHLCHMQHYLLMNEGGKKYIVFLAPLAGI